MKEIACEVWDIARDCALCITTNGYVTKDGKGVMGAGIALEAKDRYPGIESLLARKIIKNGNKVDLLYMDIKKNLDLLIFPVKHQFYQDADIFLIKQSAIDLVRFCQLRNYDKVYIPRPGCGNGRLKWDEVKNILSPILTDDKFVIVNK